LSKNLQQKCYKSLPAILFESLQTPPFQNLLHPWVQKKSQGPRSGEWGGHHHHFVFSQKLLDAQICVGGGVVMFEWMDILTCMDQRAYYIEWLNGLICWM